MRTYTVTITGKTPLIMHHDNIEWSDQMDRWKMDPKNKAKSKAGDDRTPAYRWLGSLYHDGTQIVIPSDNLMRALMTGGTLLPTGKGQKTFKAQTQSGIMAPEMFWPLLVGRTAGATAEERSVVLAMPYLRETEMQARTFDDWQEMATQDGFMLFVKRARIGAAKHIRVRPRFDNWSLMGSLAVLDEAVTFEVLQQIGELAGQYAGLGDWRPSSKTPGPYGMFEFAVKKA